MLKISFSLEKDIMKIFLHSHSSRLSSSCTPKKSKEFWVGGGSISGRDARILHARHHVVPVSHDCMACVACSDSIEAGGRFRAFEVASIQESTSGSQARKVTIDRVPSSGLATLLLCFGVLAGPSSRGCLLLRVVPGPSWLIGGQRLGNDVSCSSSCDTDTGCHRQVSKQVLLSMSAK